MSIKDLFKEVSMEDAAVVAGNTYGVDSLEAEAIEVVSAEQHMNDADQVVVDMQEIALGLEGIVGKIEQTVEGGGMTAGEAAMANLAVNAHVSRLGLESTGVASMESFGAESDRETATQVSLEAIKETLGNVWKAIKNAVQKAMKATADFFTKMFGGWKKVDDRVKALEEQVAKVEGEAGKIKAGGMSKLHVGGKSDAKTIVEGMKSLADTSDKIGGDYATAGVQFYEAIDKVSMGKEGPEYSPKWGTEDLESAGLGGLKEVSGGKIVKIDGDSLVFANADDKVKVDESAEVDALDKGEMGKVLDSVKALSKVGQAKKKSLEDMSKARASVLKSGDKFQKEADQGKLGEKWDKSKISSHLRKVQKDIVRPISQVEAHSFSAARAALSLVEKSIKAHGAEGKKEEKKDEE